MGRFFSRPVDRGEPTNTFSGSTTIVAGTLL
ncbi:hypothetical protein [Nitrobacter hamburgensis]